jgi:hypothetical protein
MTDVENIYRTIAKRSNFIIEHGAEWRKELSSAKNYITTSDLKSWTFGKSAGLNDEYHADGGAAKTWLYRKGFIDVLQLPDGAFRKKIISSFLTWTKQVNAYDVAGKFNRDQSKNNSFEILVHKMLLPRDLLKETNIPIENQKDFDEGFRTEVVKEVFYRNRNVVKAAKLKFGLKCSVCDFDFGNVYGAHGEGFIEMHHLNPISSGKRKTKVDDLTPVCSNCHRMLHKGKELLTVKELKKVMENKKASTKRHK